ncbi:MAG: hypothetical protein COV36_01025 [Alphaproteobacteria bacterium CG11_big_fil_rev_8_21_14_0_20_44_7]|nr:MAG: hypothetical protein COV36_01025 [Alphaproteobacteria bacterium CG11_big_fil_rev_8_21_14_0_20_44_7]
MIMVVEKETKPQAISEDEIVRVTICSSLKPEQDVINEVAKFAEEKTNKKVIVDCEIDGDIISGLIIKFDGEIYDHSIKTKNGVLKDQLRKINAKRN